MDECKVLGNLFQVIYSCRSSLSRALRMVRSQVPESGAQLRCGDWGAFLGNKARCAFSVDRVCLTSRYIQHCIRLFAVPTCNSTHVFSRFFKTREGYTSN